MLATCHLMAFVPTTNFEAARRFYEGTLGLRFVADDGFALVFDANGVTIRVAKVPKYDPLPFTTLGWRVADIERELGDLQARGVTFERYGLPGQNARGIWTSPSGARVAWFKDPEGNVLSISQHE